MTEDLGFHKKRRGVVRTSLTKLVTKLDELEASPASPTILENARSLVEKLKTLEQDFKNHQLAIIDHTDDLDSLNEEQKTLDDNDDQICELRIRLQCLISTVMPSKTPDEVRVATKQLKLLRTQLESIDASVRDLVDADDNVCVLEEYRDQVTEVKSELNKLKMSLLNSAALPEDPVMRVQSEVDKAAFDSLLVIKRRIRSNTTLPPTASVATVTKLPKLELPTFHGDILQWKNFWEQFCVSVHDRAGIPKEEKLMYLQNAIKDKTAKNLIAGLTKSSDHYDEAVKCLRERYNRPRQIHQTHVRCIVEAPPLKDGTGKEIRALHDLVVQHLRALASLDHEPSQAFITSLLEMKLDPTTMFEWQRHSQEHSDVPEYQVLLDFLNLRAQASEVTSDKKRVPKPVNSLVVNTTPSDRCVACGQEKHQLYFCTKFRSLSHAEKIELLRSKHHCLNCLRPGHFASKCRTLNRCKHCQRPHHTLLHIDKEEPTPNRSTPPTASGESAVTPSHHVSISSNILLMTCQVMVETPQGVIKARALLDTGSAASFVSERLAQSLHLRRFAQNARILGIAGLPHSDGKQSVTQFLVSTIHSSGTRHNVNAIIIPQITGDLPVCQVIPEHDWKHLDGLTLADPDYHKPGRIDLLLGVDVFVEVIRHGRRCGPRNSPTALNTEFGWVLAGNTSSQASAQFVTTNLASVFTGDDLLRRFWEVEEKAVANCTLTLEERSAIEHFKTHHYRDQAGRFVPKRSMKTELGESRSQAVRRFLSFERSLHSKGVFPEVQVVIDEYFDQTHAEMVPLADLEKPREQVFYMPVHIVRKESSTTTKIRAVFDASATTSTGTSLNSTLMVGPTVHPPLIDVLIRFRRHRVALVADVSRMYRAILLAEPDKDLHRFVWRNNPDEQLQDYRMTRVTFGVSASSFIANMCLKQNALDFGSEHPNAAKQVETSFCVDDYLGGADSPQEAVQLYGEMHGLFQRGGFLLRKWNSSDPSVLESIPTELKDSQAQVMLSDSDQYTKTLGIEWNVSDDHFRVNVTELPLIECRTKRSLVSDVAKTFDVLGWFSPTIVKAKILLQGLWLEKIGWDDPVPDSILQEWSRWRSELPMLSEHHIPRCYHPKEATIISTQLHGFSDASEKAYSGVVYIRMEDSNGMVYTSMITSKTRVAPIKRLTIPRLELNGALVLAQLLSHCKDVLDLPVSSIHAWTDSTIVLAWIQGNPQRFKVYVGNRVAQILELTPADCWQHVVSEENPADCASRGVFPSELLRHDLWWNGPPWLQLNPSNWPTRKDVTAEALPREEKEETCLVTSVLSEHPIIPLNQYSSFTRLQRVTAWILRFIANCRSRKSGSSSPIVTPNLTVSELAAAERYWLSLSQQEYFLSEITLLEANHHLPNDSCLISLHPFVDSAGILRVGGREINSTQLEYSRLHPIILHGKHPITKLIIRSEHLRLLHAGPTLLSASLGRRFHMLQLRKTVRSVTRQCITCRRQMARPLPQMLGQLPLERVTPGSVFEKVGVDYAGPFHIKSGSIRKPTILKSYVCVFVSLSVKAVHLELVSDLTTEAFIATLRRFIARRGYPTLIWSDHGTNFVGAKREIKELYEFLGQQATHGAISDLCASSGIEWRFIPEHGPHFGGLWEAAVKSAKTHLKRVVGEVKLNFEELTTVLTQVEACLNSRPLVTVVAEDDGIEILTPGHFLVGHPLSALPDPSFSYRSLSLLRRWHLCQSLVRHFWQRWSSEYLTSLNKYNKWRQPTRNISVGDVVLLREDATIPTKWPIARVMQVHPGKDNLVRVATIKTSRGTYRRPVTKLAVLLNAEH